VHCPSRPYALPDSAAARAQAELSCSIVGSSIALLSGQKPPFRLLVRAIRTAGPGGGAVAGDISSAVSDDFIVATQRVKTAQKARRPPGAAGGGVEQRGLSGNKCRLRTT
jgi:hypothetical protein